ncbi:MAG: hypothetical protein ACFFDF_08515 [Candidatus Odinarchaeota archaeon]
MPVNEVWELEMKNLFNTQKATLYISIIGNSVTGRMERRKETSDITDGKIYADTLMWKASRKFPKFLKFEFYAKVEGDTMLGVVKSPLGKAYLKGTRISHEVI